MNEVFIVAAKRTPVGGFLGSLSKHSATYLGALAIDAVCTGMDKKYIDSVYMGNVLSAGLGQSPARQASLGAGLPAAADCTTVNKVCASGLKAIAIAAQQVQLGIDGVVVAGGMESMSNTPHYLLRRKALKMDNDTLVDGLLRDGLQDAYQHYHMGYAAELCVREFGITREDQDQFALASYGKAAEATRSGRFANEIIPVETGNSNEPWLQVDEDVAKVIPAKVPMLRPVFDKEGTITAANASNLNDGAAAFLLASREAAVKHGLVPVARIVAYADAADLPERYTTAPALAIRKVLRQARLAISDIDYFEINEAYAAVAIVNRRLLEIDDRKLNVYGGAVAIGHPLGASGARLCCTLLSVLQQEGGRYGLAAICNGGGGATALIVENLAH
ncbi:MAG: acetyl-CoA C-acyltransferase [Sphingobacteriales bacterium]|nr:MAG: acetyl-CoA C-acyltransferase [Sphingobacteriales bacterium]